MRDQVAILRHIYTIMTHGDTFCLFRDYQFEFVLDFIPFSITINDERREFFRFCDSDYIHSDRHLNPVLGHDVHGKVHVLRSHVDQYRPYADVWSQKDTLVYDNAASSNYDRLITEGNEADMISDDGVLVIALGDETMFGPAVADHQACHGDRDCSQDGTAHDQRQTDRKQTDDDHSDQSCHGIIKHPVALFICQHTRIRSSWICCSWDRCPSRVETNLHQECVPVFFHTFPLVENLRLKGSPVVFFDEIVKELYQSSNRYTRYQDYHTLY